MSCAEGAGGGADAGGLGEGFLRGASGGGIDADFTADRVALVVRARLVGIVRAGGDQVATGRDVRLLVGAHFAIALLQLSEDTQVFAT